MSFFKLKAEQVRYRVKPLLDVEQAISVRVKIAEEEIERLSSMTDWLIIQGNEFGKDRVLTIGINPQVAWNLVLGFNKIAEEDDMSPVFPNLTTLRENIEKDYNCKLIDSPLSRDGVYDCVVDL